MKNNSFKRRNEPAAVDMKADTPLNPGFSLGVDADIMNPAGKDYISGESVDGHRVIEQANEYIAEEEIKQQFENL